MPSIFGQKTISITEYLQSTYAAKEIKSDAEGLSFLRNYNYNLPLISSINLRSETHDFLLNSQEYSIRIKPNSLKAISLQNKVYQNRIDKTRIDNQLNFNEALKKRYLSIIDYFFTEELIKLKKKEEDLEKDRLKVLNQSIYDTNFDIKDLIASEEVLLSLALKLKNLKAVKEVQQFQLKNLPPFQGDSLRIDFTTLISEQQIINHSNQFSEQEPVEVAKQKLELKTLESEMRLAKAKSNRWLDFLQAKYMSSPDELFNEKLSIGIGINIPFFGNNRQQRGDYYFEKLSKESELIVLEDVIRNNHLLMQNKFENTVMNFQVKYTQLEKSSVVSLLENYKKMEGISPLLILNLVSFQYKKEIEVMETKHELYKAYIDILANQGVLFQKPLRNFLSINKEFIMK